MITLFKNRTFATLFAAQVVALLGSGLMTVALGLLAFSLAGERAGMVLGTAYAIKMLAYVGLSPVMAAITATLPRKAVMVAADLARATVAMALPFITEVWQVYVLIFLLQAASATFTPVFQATIPDILPKERDYTRALSLSRLAYDIENLLSPALAALLLTVMSFHGLFAGAVVGFLVSAMLVLRARMPIPRPATTRPFRDRLTRGSRIYLATPRLRGLLALNLAAAAVGAFVLVNTVVLVKVGYGAGDRALGVAMAAFGAGSMLAALILPRLLDRIPDRSVMMPAGAFLVALSLGLGLWLSRLGLPPWSVLLALWAAIGMGYSAVLTPSGRLLKRSAHPEDRPALFAAQFALSHACWLLTYPLAGWVGGVFGLPAALAILGGIALVGVAVAHWIWPAGMAETQAHEHPDLPADHPHLCAHDAPHSHEFVIDDLHVKWPPAG
ncbi:MFS transporter [Aliiroseovarius subalbicans]|uniref:MFS transporter n=1 Tax=Aliiroseovarius subalbicans TaxID=2925840 RepID=UPI001F56C593|nr:MFS transporter [Aliiroseovarius subalbicans]MCI2399350.1 MFS transporter [Aliiroseovarius subalbicans]